MCQDCRDAAEAWQGLNPNPDVTDASTQTAVRMSSVKHYQVLQIAQDPSPSKNSRKMQHRKRNKATREQDVKARDCADDETNQDGDGDEEQKEEAPIPDAASSHSSSASIQIHTDAPGPVATALAKPSIEGYQPTKLSSDVSTALRQVEGDIDKMDDRTQLGRDLRKALEPLSKLSPGEQEDARAKNMKLKVLIAKWNAGL
ncbi:hypothetical protein LTR70_008024 [Exophiala xenobiotica]|uniref:Uncharacterized protein n=1 Tax=Lithohypha guttulata TaxID=1690604 RepID=A0ABR0K341_9EURO|nr:hypothetical protein LTR24_007599 [Lithohypha guttulata]KAK5312654.1 hypothetical protein LTR70_008024 [Exophiala xenobiotica]